MSLLIGLFAGIFGGLLGLDCENPIPWGKFCAQPLGKRQGLRDGHP